MDKCLTFEMLWNDKDLFQLRVSASNGQFSGTADVYIPIGGLAETATKLKGFPCTPADHREVKVGEFGQQWAGGAVKLCFYCKGSAGNSFVECWFESDFDSSSIAETAHFHAPVEASAIDSFVIELESLEENVSGSAVLTLAVL